MPQTCDDMRRSCMYVYACVCVHSVCVCVHFVSVCAYVLVCVLLCVCLKFGVFLCVNVGARLSESQCACECTEYNRFEV